MSLVAYDASSDEEDAGEPPAAAAPQPAPIGPQPRPPSPSMAMGADPRPTPPPPPLAASQSVESVSLNNASLPTPSVDLLDVADLFAPPADNASRKRKSNGSGLHDSCSKFPRMQSQPQGIRSAAGNALIPPQLRGSHLGISKVKDKYGFRETMLDNSMGTALIKHAAITDASCSKNNESWDDMIVKQGMLIQHLAQKIPENREKLTSMERDLHQLNADHQEALIMLDVAKSFFNCFKPTGAAANAAISFLSEDADNIVQKINYMKEFFSYYVPPDHVNFK